jgi:hypothetical protein
MKWWRKSGCFTPETGSPTGSPRNFFVPLRFQDEEETSKSGGSSTISLDFTSPHYCHLPVNIVLIPNGI